MAVFIALLVGFGIAAFYTAPPRPEPPRPVPVRLKPPPPPQPTPPAMEYKPSPEDEGLQQEYQEYENRFDEYRKSLDAYKRQVFFMASGLGLAIFASSFFFPRLPVVITSGMFLGGLFTYVYGVAQGFGPMSFRLRFAAIAVGLGALIYLGLRRLRSA